MSTFTVILIVIAPILFIVGVINNALKEQKRLEQGELKRILDERKKKAEKAKRLSEKTRIKGKS
ncbi:MAG: hypothetical protein ACI4ND_08370 [Succinivibrio sp.]